MSNYRRLITDGLIFIWAYGFLSTTDLLQLICILELRNPSWRKFRSNVRRDYSWFCGSIQPFRAILCLCCPSFLSQSRRLVFFDAASRENISVCEWQIKIYVPLRRFWGVCDCYSSPFLIIRLGLSFPSTRFFSFVNDKGDNDGKNLSRC